MDSRLRFLWVILLVAACIQLSQSQTTRLRDGVGSCPQVNLEDFGNTSSLSMLGILPEMVGIRVKVNRFNLVCESIGLTRKSTSSISVIVEYDRESFPGSEVGINRGLIAQVTLDCKEDGSSFDTASAGSKLKTVGVLGNLSTPVDLKCGICIDPTFNMSASTSTHCLACKPECNEGLMRCTGLEDGQCCNWFSNNFCVNKCPGDMIGDPETFDCVSTTKLSPTTGLPSVNTSKKNCGSSCITGIIVSIVGIIFLVAIISAIAYGIYTYLNHPDTTISKDGIPDNKNYIAKDNPLYLDPSIVMQQNADEGDTDKA